MYFMKNNNFSVMESDKMKRKKKVRIKYKSFLLVLIVLLSIFMIPKLFSHKEEINLGDKVTSYQGKSIDELEEFIKENNLEIEKEYQYNDTYSKDMIINIQYLDKVNVVVSLGKLDKDVYKEKGVNELGKVPIMMYHGIIDTKENKYTGGNVDKDGYNRTADAFRADLEFYYNSGYRMIRLSDYINGIIDVELGYSPIILTFDDGNKNNFNVLGKNDDGSLNIDPECAVGILEEFKKKHPDMNVTATFFLMDGLFNQSKYNEDILKFLIDNGYDIGNHTTIHPDFTTINTTKTQEVVGKMYQKLDKLLGDKYVKILALPFGSPYKKTHENYPYILKGEYNGYTYETEATLRVGWEPELSPFNKDFDKYFLKRCRAYDNNGKEFDIESVFKNLEKNKYISDGNKDLIVIKESDKNKLNDIFENIVMY